MKHRPVTLLLTASLFTFTVVKCDVFTDWNITTVNIAVAAQLPTPPTNRIIAIAQTAAFEAANAITGSYPQERVKLTAAPGASVDAAIAAACRATLSKLVPSQQAAITSAYEAALSVIKDTPAKAEGIATGEKAAAAILAMCMKDGADARESYRPRTSPGMYVPTAAPAVPQWPQRVPWILERPDQFRPAPPPELGSELWARDYNEIKAVGNKNSSTRTAEQTAVARFWEATAPSVYYPVVRSVANAPGRTVMQNARLFSLVAQAMDDALIAVFDAKYHYTFWRPITAIRNGDADGNEATERDPSWVPFIDTPMHPEYPCAHCIVAAAIGAILRADIGTGTMPTLSTTSPTAPGVVRSWTRIEDFVEEVANARIYDGVHYRNSTEVGTAMGTRIGELAASRYLQPVKQ